MTLILDHNGRPTGGAATPFALPQPLTFSSIFGGAQATYFHGGYDQALERSREDALLMRNDCFLMGLLQERKLGTAGLRWHLEVDDERDPFQKMVRDHLENGAKAVKHLPRDVFMPLMEAIWFGRSGVQAVWKWEDRRPPPITMPAMSGVPGSSTPPGAIPTPVMQPIQQAPVRTLTLDLKAPVNGDKIGHRYSGLPYVEVNVAEGSELKGAQTIVTTQTRAMLLKGTWRDRFLLHVHAVEDPDYFDAKRGDMIYGVGIRSTLFWHDWLKREYLAWLTDFLERYGLGLTLVSYDESNPSSKAAAQKVINDINGRSMAVMIPIIPGQTTLKDSLVRIETPSSAAEVILKLMELFDHYIRYYVIGDEGNTQGRGKGGDEVREMTSAKWKMYRLDALNLADTLTSDYLDLVKRWTFPWADFPVRWKFDLDSPDVGERIGAMNKLWEMGVRIKEDEARGLLGMSKPQEGDDVISKQQMLAAEAALKPLPDPNRDPAGKFGVKGKTEEDEPGGNPEPSENGNGQPAEPAQFSRTYTPRAPTNPGFEELHHRVPAGNPDGGDWTDTPGAKRPGRGKGAHKAEPAKPAAAQPSATPAKTAPMQPVAPSTPPETDREKRVREMEARVASGKPALSPEAKSAAPAPEPSTEPPMVGTTHDGTKVAFVPHEKQRPDETTVLVSPKALEDAWRGNPMYVPPGGEGQGGKRKSVEAFLATGKPVQAPRATLGPHGEVDFTDGRHRFSVLRDRGIDQIAVTVPKDQADLFRSLGADKYARGEPDARLYNPDHDKQPRGADGRWVGGVQALPDETLEELLDELVEEAIIRKAKKQDPLEYD